jgi:hypothetical protein
MVRYRVMASLQPGSFLHAIGKKEDDPQAPLSLQLGLKSAANDVGTSLQFRQFETFFRSQPHHIFELDEKRALQCFLK